MGLFGAAHRWREAKKNPLPNVTKLCTVILYLKNIRKTYETRDKPLEFYLYQHFLPEISNFCNIKKY